MRTTSALFGAVRAAQSLVSSGQSGGKGIVKDSKAKANPLAQLQLLEEALGVAQHHDAVSGTAKQHVAFDYAKRLAVGAAQASRVLSDAVSLLRGDSLRSNRQGSTTTSTLYTVCNRLNETVCSATQLSSGTVEIVVWNSLAQHRTELITLPVPSSANIVVTSMADGKVVPIQTYAAGETVDNYNRDTEEAKYVVSFQGLVPPLGFATYSLKVLKAEQDDKKEVASTTAAKGAVAAAPVLENEFLLVNFSSTGLIESMTNKESGVSIAVSQSFGYYISNEGDSASGQHSGAYIFRPKANTSLVPIETGGGATIELTVRGDVVQEVRHLSLVSSGPLFAYLN